MKRPNYKFDSHVLEVLRGAGLAFLLRGVGAGLAFLLNVAIGRMLGAEGTGVYFLALSVTSIMAVIAMLGLDNTLLRFIASGRASGDWGQVKGVFSAGVRFAGAASLGLSLAVLVAAPWIAARLFSQSALTEPLRWMSLAIFTTTMMSLQGESLKGLKRIRDSMLVFVVISPAVALAVIWPLTSLMGPSGAALAYVLGTGTAAVIAASIWYTATRSEAAACFFDRAKLWSSAAPLWTMGIINRAVLPWAPFLLLGLWGTAQDVGIFGAATRVATLITVLLAAFQMSYAPSISDLLTHGRLQEAASMSKKIGRATGLFGLIVFLPFSLFAHDIMATFGDEFASGARALIIISLGQVLVSYLGLGSIILIMSGNEKYINIASILGGAIVILLSKPMITKFGVDGAALATAGSMMVFHIATCLFTRFRLGFFPL